MLLTVNDNHWIRGTTSKVGEPYSRPRHKTASDRRESRLLHTGPVPAPQHESERRSGKRAAMGGFAA
jgi:hypothetical protein